MPSPTERSMKNYGKKSSVDIRRQHNLELLRRMRSGDSLTSFDSRSSWFPPRPVIEKDKLALERLYHTSATKRPSAVADRTGDDSEVLKLKSRSHGSLGEA